MRPTSRKLSPVMAAISASVQPTSANRVTALPRKSRKVTPTMPAAAWATRQEARKPPPVQGLLVVLTKMRGLAFGVASSAAFNGAPTLNRTGTPVLDCRSLIWVPSGDRGGGRQRQRRLPAIYEPGKNASLKHALLTTGRDGHSGR